MQCVDSEECRIKGVDIWMCVLLMVFLRVIQLWLVLVSRASLQLRLLLCGAQWGFAGE